MEDMAMPRNARTTKGGRVTGTTRRGGNVGTTKRSPSSYSELGRLGGEAVKRTHGREFFREIGRKGGKKGGLARKRQLEGR
jgi:general stress protein YciG